MVHTFKEIRAPTPANPNEAAAEAAMPQAAWEALLRDAVQGLRKVCSGFSTVFLSLLLLAAGVEFPAACFWR